MAPKRAAPPNSSPHSKRRAPPPPVESSDASEEVADSPLTTAAAAAPLPKEMQQPEAPSSKAGSDDESGADGSDSDDSESEEAAIPEKNTGSSSSDDDDYSGSEDSDSEEPAAPKKIKAPPPTAADPKKNKSPPPTAADPKNKAPPPKKTQQPAASNEEEEEGEVEEDEEQPGLEEGEGEGEPDLEEGEEADVEATEGKGVKLPASSKGKKPARHIIRKWSSSDGLRILEALAAHQRVHGKLPTPEELEAALTGTLDYRDHDTNELMLKVKNLKAAHSRYVKGQQSRNDKVYNLSKEVWGIDDAPANPRDFGVMCELYPHLAVEMEEVEKKYPSIFKKHFGMISDEKAKALDTKVEKRMMLQSKVDQQQSKVDQLRKDTFNELIKVLTCLKDK